MLTLCGWVLLFPPIKNLADLREKVICYQCLGGIVIEHQGNCCANGSEHQRDCSNHRLSPTSKSTCLDSCSKSGEDMDLCDIGGVLQVWVYLHTFDILFLISPVNCPMGGSCCHLSNVMSCICKAKVMHVMMLVITKKTVQDVFNVRREKVVKRYSETGIILAVPQGKRSKWVWGDIGKDIPFFWQYVALKLGMCG